MSTGELPPQIRDKKQNLKNKSDCCPTLHLDTTIGDCDANCIRTVTLTYTVTPALNPDCPEINGILTIHLSNYDQVISIDNSSLSGLFVLHIPPGSYTATLSFTNPVNCQPVIETFDVPGCCPNFSFQVSVGDCLPWTGERRAEVSYMITPPPGNAPHPPIQGTLYIANQIIQITDYINSPTLLYIFLAPGNYQATLNLTTPSGCPQQTYHITVPPCPTPLCCPTCQIDTKIGACDENYARNVTLTYMITPGQNPKCPEIDGTLTIHSNNYNQVIPINSSSLAGDLQLHLPPGPYTTTLAFNSPPRCPHETGNFIVPSCPQLNCCPTINIDTKIGGCDGNNARDVTLTYIVTPASIPTCPEIYGTLIISSNNYNQVIPINSSSLAGDVQLHLPPGSYTATVTLDSPLGCPQQPYSFVVPSCPDINCCPTILIGTKNGDCDENYNRHVTLNYTITPALNPNCPKILGSLTIESSDYSLTIPIDELNNPGSLVETLNLSLPPGHYTATLTLITPGNCPQTTQSFDVNACCPDLSFTYYQGKCFHGSPTRLVIVTYSITPPPGTPSTSPISGTLSVAGTFITINGYTTSPVQHVFNLSPGDYQAVFHLTQPSALLSCPKKIFPLHVDPCPESSCCPTISITPEIGGCDENANTRKVTITYAVTPVSNANCPKINGSLTVHSLDSLNLDQTRYFDSTSLSGSYELHLPPGQYTITESFISPAGCPAKSRKLIVDPCPESNCCPTLALDATVDCCNGNNTRNVSLIYTITKAPYDYCPKISGTLTIRDSTTNQVIDTVNVNDPGSLTGTIPHTLPPGDYDYTATLTLTTPQNCPNATANCSFTVKSCCPDLSISVSAGACLADCTRQATVTYTLTNQYCLPSPDITGTLTFSGPGLPPQTVTIPPFHEPTYTGTHVLSPTLPAGVYQATLVISSPAGCCPATTTKDFIVPPCCPTNATISPDVKESCNDDGTGHVVITANIASVCPIEGETRIKMKITGDDVSEEHEVSELLPYEFIRQGDYPCGKYQVAITYPDMPGCSSSGEFCIPTCESLACYGLRHIFMGFSVVALTAIVLWIFAAVFQTGPDIPLPDSLLISLGVLALSSLVSAVIWYFWWDMSWGIPKPCLKSCKKCRLALTGATIGLAWILCFLLLGRYAITNLWTHSMLWFIILLVVFVIICIAIGVLIWWWNKNCCPTICQIWTFVLITLFLCSAAYLSIKSVLGSSFPQFEWIITSTSNGTIIDGEYLLGALIIIVGLIQIGICQSKKNRAR